jgi:hypothetical protein
MVAGGEVLCRSLGCLDGEIMAAGGEVIRHSRGCFDREMISAGGHDLAGLGCPVDTGADGLMATAGTLIRRTLLRHHRIGLMPGQGVNMPENGLLAALPDASVSGRSGRRGGSPAGPGLGTASGEGKR